VCVRARWFPSSDQIDENLKLTLQEDLTCMAPGLIIQVLGRRHGRRKRQQTNLRESLHTSINVY
jgi:redox-regulated HSP33 family molecular chaperone